jgi:hypothetical protein
VNVLNALELGSNWTIAMHRELDAKIASAGDHGPLEFGIIGSQRPDEFSIVPVEYAIENGSDGVVRVAASNLNFNYLSFVPVDGVEGLDPKVVHEEARESWNLAEKDVREADPGPVRYRMGDNAKKTGTPFAIVHECSHTYKSSSILGGTRCREQVLKLVRTALETDRGTMPAAVAAFDQATIDTREAVRPKGTAHYALVYTIRRQPQYDGFAQVVFRIFDQYNAPVPHFNLYFNSFGGDKATKDIINDLFEDGHPNAVSRNTITFYIRVEAWGGPKSGWVDRLAEIGGCNIEIDAIEHGNDKVAFVPFNYKLKAAQLAEWVQPNKTTVVDVKLYRMPSSDVFKIVPSP